MDMRAMMREERARMAAKPQASVVPSRLPRQPLCESHRIVAAPDAVWHIDDWVSPHLSHDGSARRGQERRAALGEGHLR